MMVCCALVHSLLLVGVISHYGVVLFNEQKHTIMFTVTLVSSMHYKVAGKHYKVAGITRS